MKLTPSKRDELLIRIDERQILMVDELKEIKEHNIAQNTAIATALELTTANKTAINNNRTWINVIKWIGGILGAIILTELGWLITR